MKQGNKDHYSENFTKNDTHTIFSLFVAFFSEILENIDTKLSEWSL